MASAARRTVSTATLKGGPTGRTRPVRPGTSSTGASLCVSGCARSFSTCSGTCGSVSGVAARALAGSVGPSCRVCCGAPSGASGASPTCPAAGSSFINAGTSRRTSTRSSAGGRAGTTVARAGPFTAWFTVFCRGASYISRSGVSPLGGVRTTGDPAGSVDGRRKPTGVLDVTPTPTVIGDAITRRSSCARPRRVTPTPFFSSAPGAGGGPTITRRLTPSATSLSPVAVRRHARVSSTRGK